MGKILSRSEASASPRQAPVPLLQMRCLGGDFASIPPPAHAVLQLHAVHAVGDGVTDGLRQRAMKVLKCFGILTQSNSLHTYSVIFLVLKESNAVHLTSSNH